MICVIKSNEAKKNITRFCKDNDFSVKVYTFTELLAERNSKIKQKTKKLSPEIFSTEFDLPLNSHKNEIGLRDCLFIKSEDDILDFVNLNYECLEIIV